MSNTFEDPNDFDRYAREHGGWAYDNGWHYKGETFGAAYMRNEKSEAGTLVEYLLMLREGDTPGRTLVLHYAQNESVEVWSGQVETRADFDQMTVVVDDYVGRRRDGGSAVGGRAGSQESG